MKDYYGILGVPENASPEEIKKAFRELAKKYHPDAPGGDQEKFKEILEAYRVLSDPKLRKEYDAQRKWQTKTGFDFTSPGFDFTFNLFTDLEDYLKKFFFEDEFSEIFGKFFEEKKKRDYNIYLDLELNLEEYFQGTQKRVFYKKEKICSLCEGTGSETKKKIICSNCQGRGKVTHSSSFLGSFLFEELKTCPVCRGEGYLPEKPCKVCQGNGFVYEKVDYNVKIPPKANSNKLIFKNLGHEGKGVKGDLVIKLKVKSNLPQIEIINDRDLLLNYRLNVLDVFLNNYLEINFFDAKIKVSLPVEENEPIRIKGLGLFGGDLYLKINYHFPKLKKEHKDLIKKIRDDLKNN